MTRRNLTSQAAALLGAAGILPERRRRLRILACVSCGAVVGLVG